MICVNCGMCCFDFPVVIISREYAELDITKIDDFPEEAFIIKNGNTPCTYLKWINDKSQCEVHSKPWFKSTPCHDFGQIEESPNCVCRIGEWILEKRKTDNRFNYRLKCETFIEPKTAEELNSAFRQIKEKE